MGYSAKRHEALSRRASKLITRKPESNSVIVSLILDDGTDDPNDFQNEQFVSFMVSKEAKCGVVKQRFVSKVGRERIGEGRLSYYWKNIWLPDSTEVKGLIDLADDFLFIAVKLENEVGSTQMASGQASIVSDISKPEMPVELEESKLVEERSQQEVMEVETLSEIPRAHTAESSAPSSSYELSEPRNELSTEEHMPLDVFEPQGGTKANQESRASSIENHPTRCFTQETEQLEEPTYQTTFEEAAQPSVCRQPEAQDREASVSNIGNLVETPGGSFQFRTKTPLSPPSPPPSTVSPIVSFQRPSSPPPCSQPSFETSTPLASGTIGRSRSRSRSPLATRSPSRINRVGRRPSVSFSRSPSSIFGRSSALSEKGYTPASSSSPPAKWLRVSIPKHLSCSTPSTARATRASSRGIASRAFSAIPKSRQKRLPPSTHKDGMFGDVADNVFSEDESEPKAEEESDHDELFAEPETPAPSSAKKDPKKPSFATSTPNPASAKTQSSPSLPAIYELGFLTDTNSTPSPAVKTSDRFAKLDTHCSSSIHRQPTPTASPEKAPTSEATEGECHEDRAEAGRDVEERVKQLREEHESLEQMREQETVAGGQEEELRTIGLGMFGIGTTTGAEREDTVMTDVGEVFDLPDHDSEPEKEPEKPVPMDWRESTLILD
ncbi:hypothetical protein BJ508DRAFT_327286 [Ascobolus immersus RN42]|uniref:Uncharacterized protein n=1 Tax=Ascobolus immersus RN42 TaxID=1160509 RepID=A0A3N4I538_ASCIM|nr:hypothetical protein BJ508DRAFT_327286 [Ascobolus immersus RN42]